MVSDSALPGAKDQATAGVVHRALLARGNTGHGELVAGGHRTEHVAE